MITLLNGIFVAAIFIAPMIYGSVKDTHQK